MPDRPNVVLIITDQHRGDCVGADPECPLDADGHPLVHTPNLNSMVGDGALFSSAYSPAPSCLPARRCLWTGLTPASTGVPGWYNPEWDHDHYLPQLLADNGYQTALVGKFHNGPKDRDHGFQQRIDAHHATGAEAFLDGPDHEYDRWLWERSDGEYVDLSNGLESNTWDARPTHLEEQETDTFWRTNRGLEVLSGMDTDRPFFFTLSYWDPHQPFDPPELYYEMYRDVELPDPHLGDWVEGTHGHRIPDYPGVESKYAKLPGRVIDRARACYYGLITQIDQQLTRVTRLLSSMGELENTYIVMTSDHGEMLGDHHLWSKPFAYEGAARIPLIMRFPERSPYERQQFVDAPVGLEDIMPTVLDIADIDVPDAVEGRSLLDLIERPGGDDWREFYHGEHASHERWEPHQYLVTDREKYVWNPVTGNELLFDLENDPGETIDLSTAPASTDRLSTFRDRLVAELEGRNEEFTRDGELLAKDRPVNWLEEGITPRD